MSIDLNAPLAAADPEIAAQIENEVTRQHEGLEMIASENFVSRAVLEAAGTVSRTSMPRLSRQAVLRWLRVCRCGSRTWRGTGAKQLFGAEHVNVQPHSGSQRMRRLYMTLLTAGGYDPWARPGAWRAPDAWAQAELFGQAYRVSATRSARTPRRSTMDELEETAIRRSRR